MERDDSWRRLFDRLPVDRELAEHGIFHVTADDLKRHGGREPRLMAKIDILAERPAPLVERGLALFPTRNGRYALFPDPEQKSFFRFPVESFPPVRAFRSAFDLSRLDTYPRGQEMSESQALDFAYLSSMLSAFCGDESMRLTMRGRFFSGDFSFRTPLKSLPVEVSRVQIEVDAGFEGDSGLYLVEAKRGHRQDFHVRQLWYPYLHWAARTGKRIMPIFFTYSNGIHLLSEFALGRDFGDVRLVRQRAYCLEEPLADMDLPVELAQTPVGPIPAEPFPQANDLDKLVDLVQAAAVNPLEKTEIAERFGFNERQGDYYGNAGCYLGFLRRGEIGFEASPEGVAFALLRSRAERTRALIRRMAAIPGLRSALGLLVERGYRVEKISPEELASLMPERDDSAPSTSLRRASTALRRASTLRAWLVWLMANLIVRRARLDGP